MASMGYVTKHRRPDGRLAFRPRIYVYRQERSLGLYDTEEEALRVAELAQEEANRDRAGGLTLERWGRLWLDRRELDPAIRAAKQDRSLWRTHVTRAHFYRWRLARIKPADVRRWVRELGGTEAMLTTTTGRGAQRETTLRPSGRKLSRSTVRNALSVLRQALQDAADEGRGGLRSNPAREVRVAKRARTDEGWTYLSAEEVRDVFLLPLRAEQRAIFAVAIYGGLRLGEILGLRWCDVQPDRLVVRYSYRGPTKSGKPRHVPILPQLAAELARWRRERPGVGEALVFPSTRTGGCHAKDFDAGWPRVADKLGRHVRFHDLRHTCASHLIMGTWGRRWSLRQVQAWLGHSTFAVTERYAHLDPESIVELAKEPGEVVAMRRKDEER